MDRTKILFLAQEDASKHAPPLLDDRRFAVLKKVADANASQSVLSLQPDVVFLQHTATNQRSWEEVAKSIRRADPNIPLILLAGNGSEELAVAALRLGLRDYVTPPVTPATLVQAVERALAGRKSNIASRSDFPDSHPDPMIGANADLCRTKLYMAKAAATDCTVLITGETGTGKELAAEFIHNSSRRKSKPFVCVNCAAIPDSLLESELFGYVKGAFTGAQNVHDGLLAAADGGTVFLDEIGDMTPFAQAKILRVLERKEVCRLGATRSRQLDVRFVAATNQDLEAMANRGSFRKDLFFRLNVARVELLPLRERKDDIPLLIDHYRRHFSERAGWPAPEFSKECWHCLMQHDWPGNIRELKNVIESLLLSPASGEVGAEQLPPRLRQMIAASRILPSSERDVVLAALCSARWNKSEAAKQLQWSRMTLYRKMAKYRIRHAASSVPPELLAGRDAV